MRRSLAAGRTRGPAPAGRIGGPHRFGIDRCSAPPEASLPRHGTCWEASGGTR